jgi:hypothetical protein
MGWKVELLRETTLTYPGDITVLGELKNPRQMEVSYGLSRMSTFRATFNYGDTDSSLLDDALASGPERLIRLADENGAARFYGHIINVEEVASNGRNTLRISAADPFWKQTKAVALGGQGSVGSPLVRTQLAIASMEKTNSSCHFNVLSTVGIGSTYLPVFEQYRKSSDVVQELAAALDGFEWRMAWLEKPFGQARVLNGVDAGVPTPQSNGTLAVARMDMAAVIGSTSPVAAFEYGFGKHNVAGYTRRRNSEQMAIRIYSPYRDVNGNPQQVSSVDSGLFDEYGNLTDVVSSSAITQDIAQKLADEHVRIRKRPRETITFQPTRALDGRSPTFPTDYNVGDVVTFEAHHQGAARIARVNMRVYGVSVAFDDGGNPTPTLTLMPGDA